MADYCNVLTWKQKLVQLLICILRRHPTNKGVCFKFYYFLSTLDSGGLCSQTSALPQDPTVCLILCILLVNSLNSPLSLTRRARTLTQQSKLLRLVSTIAVLRSLEGFTLALLLCKLTKQFTHFPFPVTVPTNQQSQHCDNIRGKITEKIRSRKGIRL